MVIQPQVEYYKSRKYDDPRHSVEKPERKFAGQERTLVTICTHFPHNHWQEYKTRSQVDPDDLRGYQHDRIKCLDFVLACFRHFEAGARYDLIIVDNSSPNKQACEWMNGLNYPRVYTRENTYFSFGAYRWAYHHSIPNAAVPDLTLDLKSEFDYLLFMEMDWVPAKHGWLKDLMDHWHSDREIGMIGNFIEARGVNYPPETEGQEINNAFIEKINPNRQFHYNLDSEYLFTSREVLDKMMKHDGWLMFPCEPETELPPTYNELAFQQPILEMGYKLSCYDDGNHTMFYATHNRDFPPKWDHGLNWKLAPLIPEQSRYFRQDVRDYFHFYPHNIDTAYRYCE